MEIAIFSNVQKSSAPATCIFIKLLIYFHLYLVVEDQVFKSNYCNKYWLFNSCKKKKIDKVYDESILLWN